MNASFHAINAIVNEAADATAGRVAVNAATIVNGGGTLRGWSSLRHLR